MPAAAAITFQGFTLDTGSGTLTGPDGPVALRPKTLALLDLLARNPGRALSKDELLDAVWAEVTVSEDTLTQTIHELRKALGQAGPLLIRTMPRRGYLFAADAPVPASSGTTLSVLPFANLSSDPEQRFFAEGLTTDLEAALGLIHELDVLPVRNGVTDARYRLSGSVRAAGDGLRVTTRLTDARNDRAVWNGRFDGAKSDIFAFQDEITRKLAVALQIELTTGDFARLWDGKTTSLAAWERLVAARAIYMRWNEADNRRARQLLEDTVAIDPDYTGAWVLLAKTWWYDARFFPSIDRDLALDQAERIATQITRRDPQAAGGWMVLGGTLWLRDRHDEALALCRRACALAPGDAWAHGFLGLISTFSGDEQAALAVLATAERLAPMPFDWILFHQAHVRIWTGDLAGALQRAEAYRAAAPDDPWGLVLLALVHGFAGRPEAARRAIAELRAGSRPLGLADVRLSQRHRDPARLDKVVRILSVAGLGDG